ncbi:ring-1,2-phenylacetyl-CoA epoxidase subunit PaaC [Actinopolyspora lacussalsi subsp. righensis]|uniref:Ring-1,2-phenylacetyl-CoA epoxidase subunit PaaC n=1 Tax=Actinopolyspora righensis TaxID=995060 RepID=A0A1I6ZAR4_9ACTN|nr:1,2-phenylacetyl-CoA epoxidase subunit PaaC [Actinopolyspora righensis]SFT59802.1 ring-1,2-phenylacetyl-CoA epoxidase subunit PaaC [Actinopolyspora righensis]
MVTSGIGDAPRWFPERRGAREGGGTATPESISNPLGEQQRWTVRAAGTPLTSTDRGVPDDVSAADLSVYCMMLGDDALVLARRQVGWCQHSPDLEEDCVQVGMLLESLGHARELLHRAATVEDSGRDENLLAHERGVEEFRNVRLVELDCGPGAGGDFAVSIARLMVCAAWRTALFGKLVASRDPVLSELARVALPEVRGHRDHAAQWVIRLGDGTSASRERMSTGLARVWPMTGELFVPHPVERRLADLGFAVDPAGLRTEVAALLDEVLSVARLEPPDARVFHDDVEPLGRTGVHTTALEFLLAEMRQYETVEA